MFRKIGFGAAAALTVGMLAVGCSEDGDTILQGGSTLRPSNFPGSQVDENNVAADARAFTPAGEDFEDGFWVFWNRANGQALVLWESEDDDDGSFLLNASHFNGTSLSAPVQIRGNGNGAVEDPFSSVSGVKVLWLNTAGNADPDVAAKNGDALILFTRNDLDLTTNPGNTSNEDSNERVWITHFNVSDANAPATGTINRGFETAAVALDTDILSTGADTGIGTFGFVSDSLAFTHAFTSGTDITDSGQSTSYVYVFYGKDTTTGTNLSPRFRFVTLDLAATTLPSAGGTDLALGAGTFDTDEGANINGTVLVHNNAMIWESQAVGDASGDDNVVTVTFFNTGGTGVGNVSTLNETLTANNDNTSMPSASNIYGPDNGISKLVAFYLESGYTDGAVGSRAGDTDAKIATFTVDSSTATTVERQEIDNFQDVISATISGAAGGVTEIQTRISRPGNYILALMLGDNTNVTTGGALVHDRLYARAYQTQPVGTATTANRTLANSLTSVLTPPAIASSTTQAQADVTAVQFQENLAQGQTSAQADGGFADRGCSFQGNHLRMNFLYQQLGDQAGTATSSLDQNRLLVNGVVVDLDETGTAAPTATLVSTSEVVVDTVDTTYIGTYDAAAFDAGDATKTTANPPVPTATAGRVIVFFISQDNNRADDDSPTTEFTEQRLYAWESGTVVTVSTNPSDATQNFFQVQTPNNEDSPLLGAAVVPVNENTAQAPDHVGNTLHVYWAEEEVATTVGSTSNRLDLGTRSYDLGDTAATTAVALADRFTPPTSDEPLFIDGPGGLLLFGENYQSGGPSNGSGLDGSDSYETFTVVRQGSTVGVFFDQESRIFYQQTSGDATGYYQANGVFTPALVDNESDRAVIDYQIESPNTCDNLSDTMVFFMKMTDDVFDNTERVQVRILR